MRLQYRPGLPSFPNQYAVVAHFVGNPIECHHFEFAVSSGGIVFWNFKVQ